METSGHLATNGLLSWPVYIARHQHYGKPPLYVNTLASILVLIGQDHVFGAAATVAVFTAFLLALSVYLLARRGTDPAFAILTAALVTSLPSVAVWSALAYPDVQLVLCVVVFLLILAWEEGSLRWRGVLLGAVGGLGMLAKTSFAAYAVLPALYWWLASRSRLDRRNRAVMLSIAGGDSRGLWRLVRFEFSGGVGVCLFIVRDAHEA